MNWQLILTSALISGIISSFIALYANERMKRVEFNFDFKKYVLKKRIETYEEIETLINTFFSEDAPKKFLIWFANPNEGTVNAIKNYQKQIHSIIGKPMWTSVEIVRHLNKIDEVLKFYLTEIEKSTEQRNLISDENNKKIYHFFTAHADLQKEYFIDITKMKKVDTFMKTKSADMHNITVELRKIIAYWDSKNEL